MLFRILLNFAELIGYSTKMLNKLKQQTVKCKLSIEETQSAFRGMSHLKG